MFTFAKNLAFLMLLMISYSFIIMLIEKEFRMSYSISPSLTFFQILFFPLYTLLGTNKTWKVLFLHKTYIFHIGNQLLVCFILHDKHYHPLCISLCLSIFIYSQLSIKHSARLILYIIFFLEADYEVLRDERFCYLGVM